MPHLSRKMWRVSITAWLAAVPSVVAWSQCPTPPTAEVDPAKPMIYPKPSDKYLVKYRFNSSDSWKDAAVYISYYGWTTASPLLTYSGYTKETASALGTSMSFVSIPVPASENAVQLQVTKGWNAPFVESDNVSVRPSAKGIDADLMQDGTVQISTKLPAPFAGEQFALWWQRSSVEGGHFQGLAFFLDPPYPQPAGSTVLKVTSPVDLAGLSASALAAYDTVDFEPPFPGALQGINIGVWKVPPYIRSVYLGQGAWVQGKLRFQESGDGGCSANGAGCVRHLYGPGVLDGSLFLYNQRDCTTDDNLSAVSFEPLPTTSAGVRDRYLIEGIVISDTSRYATDLLDNTTINNVKTLGWNGNNDGLEFGTLTAASNVFVRSGDDSLKMWGAYTTVSNATIWQNYNGGVINLGWFDNSPGENSQIDGVYVVSTDWYPAFTPDWTADINHSIQHMNNAVIASEMVPGTQFGLLHPSLYQNLFLEKDSQPQVLFSLKIVPPRVLNLGLTSQVCLTTPSVLNLNIQNVSSPQSSDQNFIGFQQLPPEYSFPSNPPCPQVFPNGYQMTGTMNVGLYNVDIEKILSSPPFGTVEHDEVLTGDNAVSVGELSTQPVSPSVPPTDIDITYGARLPSPSGPQWYSAWTAPQDDDIVPTQPPFPAASMNNTTVRMIVRPTVSGSAVRIKIENTMAQGPVSFDAVYIGQVYISPPDPSKNSSWLQPPPMGANVKLTFNGSPTLTLAAGAGAYSDPVDFPVTAFERYAISLRVASASDISGHLVGLVTNYIAIGAHAADFDGTAFSAVPSETSRVDPTKGPAFPVYWVSALEVLSGSADGAVALGDSITDGECSTRSGNYVYPDLYQRWTDLLAMRLGGSKALVDEGIAGNQIAAYQDSSGNDVAGFGTPALARIANDVLEREGATHVIFLEGTNDIFAGATGAELEVYDQRVIDAAHAIGLRIIGATLLPRGGQSKWTSAMETQRCTLNQWIRASGRFDDVIDFAAILQGPGALTENCSAPPTPLPAIPTGLSCFDGVHPNSLGYQTMASHIDLGLFRGNQDH